MSQISVGLGLAAVAAGAVLVGIALYKKGTQDAENKLFKMSKGDFEKLKDEYENKKTMKETAKKTVTTEGGSTVSKETKPGDDNLEYYSAKKVLLKNVIDFNEKELRDQGFNEEEMKRMRPLTKDLTNLILQVFFVDDMPMFNKKGWDATYDEIRSRLTLDGAYEELKKKADIITGKMLAIIQEVETRQLSIEAEQE